MKLYSLMDKKAATYGAVMMAPTDGMMVRTIEEQTPERHTVRRYPSDFDLYEVGEFDDQTGRITKDGEVRFVCNMAVVFEALPNSEAPTGR